MDFSLSTHVYLGVGTAEREDDCAAIFESLQAKYAAETNVVHNYRMAQNFDGGKF